MYQLNPDEENCSNPRRTPVARAKLKWAKPHVDIGAVGRIDHGKATLTVAIFKVLYDGYPELNPFTPFDRIDKAPEERQRGIAINIVHVEYEADKRHRAYVDTPGHADYIRSMITGATQMDDAVFMVAAINDLMAQAREHILLACQVDVPTPLMVLNKSDMVSDEKLLDLVEMEVRELLSSQDHDGDEVLVICVSTLKALRGDIEQADKVKEFMDAVNDFIPTPERDMDKPPLMPIEGAFTTTGRGVVVTGCVERGKLPINSEVEILDIREAQKTTVTSIEMFRKQMDEAWTGENYGLLLHNTHCEDVERGQVVCKPSSITPHTEFESHVYILTKDEGGRHNPFYSNYRPQFYFRTTDITGVITPLKGTEMIMPDDTTEMIVQFIQPIAMEEGLGFATHKSGHTVGSDCVTKVIE